MKLFQVNGVFFTNKMEAKAFRDLHGGCVSKGPDHYRFDVVGTQKTHSHGHKDSIGDGFPRRGR